MRVFSIFIFLGFSFFSISQTGWPTIAQSAKPWSRWWWQGSAVDSNDLSILLKKYAEAGLGGLEITPIYGVKGSESKFIEYLSPQWMAALTFTLEEAKKNGLGIDMATGTGWPFGGPWINESDAAKYFTYKTYHLKEGETIKDTLYYQQEPLLRTANGIHRSITEIKNPINTNYNLQELALDQIRFEKKLYPFLVIAVDQNHNRVNLSQFVQNGIVHWTPVAGDWTIYALFEGDHGKMVERAAPGGEGLVIDHFDSTALKKYLGKFDDAFQGNDLEGLRSFFNDSYEVDDAKGQSNFTEGLFHEFESRRGYRLLDVIPYLLDSAFGDIHKRVLHDFRETISDLLENQFTQVWTNWGHSRNKLIRNQAHGSPANILDLYAIVDIPETEGNDVLRYKFATSAAHIMDKNLASAEVSTWLDEHFKSNMADIKSNMDQFFLGGVNHIFYHGIAYSPAEAPWPGWLFYASVHLTPNDPQWRNFKALNDYAARCQSFLQSGKPDNSILLYFPFSDHNHREGKELLHHYDGMNGFENTDFEKTAHYLQKNGYAWDLISDKQLEKINNSNIYKTLIISGVEYMPLETLLKIDSLCKAGFQVMFDRLPSKVSGYKNYLNRQKLFDALIHQWDLQSTGESQSKTWGNGKIYLSNDISQTLMQGEGSHERSMYEKGLQCIRRQDGDQKIYFIKNTSNQPIKDWIVLHSEFSSAVLFDPLFAKKGKARLKVEPDQTLVWLELNPGETIILKSGETDVAEFKFIEVSPSGKITIDKNWNISFLDGGPQLPRTQKLKALTNWINLGKEEKYFSGTAKYTNNFKIKTSNNDYLLDLGEIHESAEIFLNGISVGTLIGPEFKIILPYKILKKKNKLEVLVSNNMVNRIIYMDQNNIPWKKFYNVNMPPRFSQNRGGDGLFTAKNWLPVKSGLIGPVTLAKLK
ncbi:MAG: glycosyl hydrolase [Saprospiraceae bacterium]